MEYPELLHRNFTQNMAQYKQTPFLWTYWPHPSRAQSKVSSHMLMSSSCVLANQTLPSISTFSSLLTYIPDTHIDLQSLLSESHVACCKSDLFSPLTSSHRKSFGEDHIDFLSEEQLGDIYTFIV